MKNKIICSTMILLIGGFLTKILGMIIKIIMSRTIGIDGLSLYMLVLPTFSLFISIGQAGVPISLSRFVAEDKKNNSSLYFSVLIISFIFNLILSILLACFSSFISYNLLHNDYAVLPIIAIALVIPFTSVSGICRSYFIGNQRMFPNVLSNVLENLLRLLFMILILPHLLYLDISVQVFYIILFNIISEVTSILVLLLFLPNKISFNSLRFNKKYVFETIYSSTPHIASNLIGNVAYFLEPVIFTTLLIFLGYNQNIIVQEYGIINGYVLSLLVLPSFFTMAISQAMLPYFIREYEKKNYKEIKKVLLYILLIIFCFSFFLLFVYLFFGRLLLLYIYHTEFGYTYLKIIAPFCFFYYIQSPLIYCLISIGKMKTILYISIFSFIIRITLLSIFILLGFGAFSLIYSFIINVISTSILLIIVISALLQ